VHEKKEGDFLRMTKREFQNDVEARHARGARRDLRTVLVAQRFDDIDEIAAAANDTPYALARASGRTT